VAGGWEVEGEEDHRSTVGSVDATVTADPEMIDLTADELVRFATGVEVTD